MRLTRIYLQNLRNHPATEVFPAERVNIITGLNGTGKTSILEGISLCTLARSFVASQDSMLLRRGSSEMAARVEGISDFGAPRRIEVRYRADGGKTITLDGGTGAPAVRVIGSMPTVVLFPDMKAITGGPPLHRRRFLDLVLSQAKRRYLEDLLQYRRMLKQRNAILGSARRSGRVADEGLLAPWTEGLIDRGARLMAERTSFVEEFTPILRRTAEDVAPGAEEITIAYEPDAIERSTRSLNDIRDALWLRSREVRRNESRRGTTLFGPHRDDLGMMVNGGDVRTSASQGQHKTVLVGLKVAEFHYLAAQSAETPVILLDDIFGDLDPVRAERVYDVCRGLAQVFITAVSLDTLPFLRDRKVGPDDLHLRVEQGAIASATGRRQERRSQEPEEYTNGADEIESSLVAEPDREPENSGPNSRDREE